MASGSPPLSYQWRFHGTNLTGQTGDSLVLSSVTTNQGGPYTVVVTNALGSVTSVVATLTVTRVLTLGEALDAPQLTWNTGVAPWTTETDMTHDGVDAAQSGYIWNYEETWMETTVTGPGPLSFWWKVSSESGYDYLEFYTNGVRTTRISGEVDWQQLSYALGSGSHVLRWRYMKDGGGSSGWDLGWVDQVSFTPPTGPPVIVTQPTNQTVEASATATFAVMASGSLPLSYQWRYYGTNLSGRTSASLVLTGVTTNQTGPYAVVVTNALGSVTSSVATLTVVPVLTLGEALDAPQLTWSTGGNGPWTAQTSVTHDGVDAAQSGTISHSQETWIQTTVVGPGPLSFWWKVSSESSCDYLEFYTNGVRVTRIAGEVNWQQLNYTLGAGTQVLRWRYMKDSSASSGQDRGWVDQVSFVPPGPAPPGIVQQPNKTTAVVGGTARFSVEAQGTAPLAYQWRFNGLPLGGQTDSILSLTGLTISQAGLYSVIITNAYGAITSAPAILTVLEGSVDGFRVAGLYSTGSRVIEHDALTGDDRGGIAVSQTRVFYSGDNATAGFNLTDLSGGASLGVIREALLSDLRTGQVYSLGNGSDLIARGGGSINSLIELDGDTLLPTGVRIDLSQAIPMTAGGIFAGYGRVLLWNGTNVYDVILPSGAVSDAGAVALPTYKKTENWVIWGVAEFWEGALSLVYVRDSTAILRTRVQNS